MTPTESSSFIVFIIFLLLAFVLHFGSCGPSKDGDELCTRLKRVKIRKIHEYPNGSLFDCDTHVLYPSNTHWKVQVKYKIGRFAHSNYINFGCPCLLGLPCLRKCCPLGKADFRSLCLNSDQIFRIDVTDYRNDTIRTRERVIGKEKFGILYRTPCPWWHAERISSDEFHISSRDGHLEYEGRSYVTEEYCVENVKDSEDYFAKVCLPADGKDPQYAHVNFAYRTFGYCSLVSMLFLLVTLIVYAFTPTAKYVHGKNVMCLIASLTAVNALDLVQFLTNFNRTEGTCLVLVSLYVYFSLASFWWLNVISIDIFRKSRLPPKTKAPSSFPKPKEFLLYSLYAWGCPFLFLLACIITELDPDLTDNAISPNIAWNPWCGFGNLTAQIVFLNAPISVIVLASLFLLAFTAKQIFTMSYGTSILDDKIRIKDRFAVHLQLMLAIGAFKVIEILFYALKFHTAPKRPFLWATCILYALQGMVIFLILVCKEQTYSAIRGRLRPSFTNDYNVFQ